jgi:hypothetical protein
MVKISKSTIKGGVDAGKEFSAFVGDYIRGGLKNLDSGISGFSA